MHPILIHSSRSIHFCQAKVKKKKKV
uniref:Uncharacterized protein n=1 Tax=Rhizophora mucronata TaxID=61149 RepID=A0A2P2NAN2_RHIMU